MRTFFRLQIILQVFHKVYSWVKPRATLDGRSVRLARRSTGLLFSERLRERGYSIEFENWHLAKVWSAMQQETRLGEVAHARKLHFEVKERRGLDNRRAIGKALTT